MVVELLRVEMEVLVVGTVHWVHGHGNKCGLDGKTAMGQNPAGGSVAVVVVR